MPVGKTYASLSDKSSIISIGAGAESDLLRAHALLEQALAVTRRPADPQTRFWNTHEQRRHESPSSSRRSANPFNASAFELADQAQSVYEGVMAAQRSGDPNLSSSKSSHRRE